MKTTYFFLTSFILWQTGICQTNIQSNGNTYSIKLVTNTITPELFGAIGDGTLHKLSEKFATLADAKKVYPSVNDLETSIDGAAFQKAVDIASLDSGEVLAEKKYYVNLPIVMKDNVIVDGKNKGVLINDRSRGNMLNWAFLFGDHAPYGFNKEENGGEGYSFYDVKGSMKSGQNFLTLAKPAAIDFFKVNQIVMAISSFKRKMNITKVMLPYHITMCKIVKIEGSKLYFEYPFDENVDSVQICANGTVDRHTGINFSGVQNVTLRNMTIDAAQISGSEYAYKCHIDNIRLIDGVRLVGMNAMAYSTFTNISGNFSWRGIEIKTGSHNLLVKNIHGIYKPIPGFPQPVDAISLGQYNRNITVDSFSFDFGTSSPKISTINFHSRKGTISNGVIKCANLSNAFVTFNNEHFVSNSEFGCYENSLKNVKFYGSPDMKTVFQMGDGEGVNKEKKKDNWVTEKKMSHRKNKPVANSETEDNEKLYDAIKTENVPPQGNIVANCLFEGGGNHSVVKLNSGTLNIIRNCTFSNAHLKAAAGFISKNNLSNNIFNNQTNKR